MAIGKSDKRLITDTRKLRRWSEGKKEKDLRAQYSELRSIAQSVSSAQAALWMILKCLRNRGS